MNILSLKNLLFSTFLLVSGLIYSQEENEKINISDSEMIAQLMETKTNLQKSYHIEDRYVIQIFSGSNREASDRIKEFEDLYDYMARIKYEAPNYKVWIGNFRNRIEADRALLVIKETYPSAFVPKPKRQ